MAKSSRASSTKANNQRLKAKVFGPVESARQERLSAKLLELASQPKPVPEKEMKDAEEQREVADETEQMAKADDSRFAPGKYEHFVTGDTSIKQMTNIPTTPLQPWT